MEKAMVFTCDEFEELIYEITYETVGVWQDHYDGWGFAELDMSDGKWDEWFNKFGEAVEEEVISFEDVYEFVYAMLDKKFGAKVQSIILDNHMDAVAVIFK